MKENFLVRPFVRWMFFVIFCLIPVMNAWAVDEDGDGAPESLPVSQVFIPGTGTLYLYSETANDIIVEKFGTSAFEPISGSPFSLGADAIKSVSVSSGFYRMIGRSPFLSFASDNPAGGDAMTSGVSPTGKERDKTLLVWSGEHVVVLANDGNPGKVSLQRFSNGAFQEISSWQSPGANSFNVFSVPGFDVYKVVAQGDGVSAFGNRVSNSQNNFTYIPSENGTGVGLRFGYAHPEIIGRSVLYFLNLYSGTTQVNVFRNDTQTTTVTLSPNQAGSVSLQSGSLYRLEANWQIMAWTESDPNNGTCDGTILDADLVPGERGSELDTSFLFTTTFNNGSCYTDRRSDVDILSYTDNTTVTIKQNGVSSTKTLARGERFRVGTDLLAATLFDIDASLPINVALSHAGIEFAQNSFSFFEDVSLGEDNCPEDANEDQSDRDLDGAGDACDCAPDDPNVSEGEECPSPCAKPASFIHRSAYGNAIGSLFVTIVVFALAFRFLTRINQD